MNKIALHIQQEIDKNTPIDRGVIDKWLDTDDLDVIGMLCKLIFRLGGRERVTPKLNDHDDLYYDLPLKYYRLCIIEDRETEPDYDYHYASRYDAAFSFCGWFKNIWDDSSVSPNIKSRIREWLTELYLESDDGDDIRGCLRVGILEHIFEDENISEFFADWANFPELAECYRTTNKDADDFRKSGVLNNMLDHRRLVENDPDEPGP